MSLTAQQLNSIAITTIITSFLSVLGSSFIILSPVIFPKLRTIRNLLVLGISTADLINSLLYFVIGCYFLVHGYIPPGNECDTVGGLFQYFQLACAFWIGCTTVHTFLHIKFNKNLKGWKVGLFYSFVSWVFPMFLVGFALAGNIKPKGSWCWISSERSWQYVVYQMDVVTLVLILVILLDTIAIFHIYQIAKNVTRHAVHIKAMRRLAIYPVVFSVLYIPTFINRLQNGTDPNNPIFRLFYAEALIFPLQGICNALVYGINEKLVVLYKDWIKGLRETPPINHTKSEKSIAPV